MNNIKKCLRYEFDNVKIALIILLSVVIVLNTIFTILSINNSAVYSTGEEIISWIFIGIISLSSYKEYINFLCTHTFSRRTVIKSMFIFFALLSLVVAAVSTIQAVIFKNVISENYTIMFDDIFNSKNNFIVFSDLNTAGKFARTGFIFAYDFFINYIVFSGATFLACIIYRLPKAFRVFFIIFAAFGLPPIFTVIFRISILNRIANQVTIFYNKIADKSQYGGPVLSMLIILLSISVLLTIIYNVSKKTTLTTE